MSYPDYFLMYLAPLPDPLPYGLKKRLNPFFSEAAVKLSLSAIQPRAFFLFAKSILPAVPFVQRPPFRRRHMSYLLVKLFIVSSNSFIIPTPNCMWDYYT